MRAFTTRRPGGARAIAPALGIAPARAPEHEDEQHEHDPGDGSRGHRFANIGITAGGPPLSSAPTMIQRTSVFEAAVMIGGQSILDRGGGLIVDDKTEKLVHGQMRKGDFFPRMTLAVRRTAEAELAKAKRSTDGCPYLERWLAHYQGQPAAHLERAIRRYAPASIGARRAIDYLGPLTAQLAVGIARWAKTGEIPSAPDDDDGGGGGAATDGKLLPKLHGPGAPPQPDARAVAVQLGAGQPLPASVRGPMERALDLDLAHVRIHTDGGAARLSQDLAARAFTVGSHVAFGADEFRPGDPRGDALLAHELAHVVQQHGGGDGASSVDAPGALEAEADDAAVAAVAAIHGTERDVARAPSPRPSRGRGLQLSRCDTYTPLAQTMGKRGPLPPWNNRKGDKQIDVRLQPAIQELWDSEYDVDHNTAANLCWGYPAVYASDELIPTTEPGGTKLDGRFTVPDEGKGWAASLDRRMPPPPPGGGKISREGGEDPIMLLDASLLVPAKRNELKSILVHEMSHASYTQAQRDDNGDSTFSLFETEFVARWVEPRNRALSDEQRAAKARAEIVGDSPDAGGVEYRVIRDDYWGNRRGMRARVDNYKRPRAGLNLTNLRPTPAEDWNFTRDDYAAMREVGVHLRFADDSDWFPGYFQRTLLDTLEALLDPRRKDASIVGVNPNDTFHGHIGIPRNKMTRELAVRSIGEEAFARAAYKTALGTLGDDKAGDALLGATTAHNMAAMGKKIEETEQHARDWLLNLSLMPGIVVVFHTRETTKPADMEWGSPTRNFMATRGESSPEAGKAGADPYRPPRSEDANSWRQLAQDWKLRSENQPVRKGEDSYTDAPFIALFQFSFLIDAKGVIHVRPFLPSITTAARELSVLTGVPQSKGPPP